MTNKGLTDEQKSKLKLLIDQCRDSCLWYMRKDYYPENLESSIRVLNNIESYASRDIYIEARKLKLWLLQNTKKQSADSFQNSE